MADYKAMYYHLAGRMATAMDVLEATTNALAEITEKLKMIDYEYDAVRNQFV